MKHKLQQIQHKVVDKDSDYLIAEKDKKIEELSE